MENKENKNIDVSAEEFWPGVESAIIKHHQRKRRILIFFTSLSIVSALFLVLQLEMKKNQGLITTKNAIEKSNSKSKTDFSKNNASEQNINTNSTIEETQKNTSNSNKIEQSKFDKKENSTFANSSGKSTAKFLKNQQEKNKTNADLFIENLNTNKASLQTNLDSNIIRNDYVSSRISFNLLATKIHNKINFLINEYKLPESLLFSESKEKQNASKNIHSKFYIGVSAGIDQSSKSILNKELTAATKYRKDYEKPILVSNFSVIVGYKFNRWIAESGIRLTMAGELNNYPTSYVKSEILTKENIIVNVSIVSKTDTIYNRGFQSYKTKQIASFDTLRYTTNDTIAKTINDSLATKSNGRNQYAIVQIPLAIGREFRFGKLSLIPLVGISVGILQPLRTLYYYNEKATNFATENNLNKWILNYSLAVRMSYSLNIRTLVFVQPNFQTNISSFTNENSNWKTQYNNLGMQLGVAYRY